LKISRAGKKINFLALTGLGLALVSVVITFALYLRFLKALP
jgi:hypothetical protein